MIIRNTTEEAVEAAALVTKVRVRFGFRPYTRGCGGIPYDPSTQNRRGVAHGLTLRPAEGCTQRRCAVHGNHQRIAAVCWHGHRDFFRALLAITPDAVIISRVARYDGSEGFERTFEPTGDQNIGSRMNPVAHRDACACREGAF